MNTGQDNAGDDNVIIGNRSVNGSRNVIIDATDTNGNTILSRPMVIGNNARGGPNDIVIGSGAGSGSELFRLLDKLASMSNTEVTKDITSLISNLKAERRDKNVIQRLWASIKAAITAKEAIILALEIGDLIAQAINKK